jgi:HK97 family phage portal protein
VRNYPKRPLDFGGPVVRAEGHSFPSSDGEAWGQLLGGLGTSVTPETAMRHSAVYRCVFLVAATVAMLPLHTYARAGDGDRERSDAHAAAVLLRQRPNPRMTPTIFWRAIVSNMLLRGNGVAWIERKASGEPIALWPIAFSRATPSLANGRLRYALTLDDGRQLVADQDDVLHFPGSAEWDGVKAKTPIQAMGAAVGIGLEADRYAKLFFENDANPGQYISFPNKFDAKSGAAEEVRKYYRSKFSGDKRFSGPAVFDQGGTVKQLEITAQDAQILETRRFQIEDIARVFGVPRFLLAMDETSWGTGIEKLGLAYVVYTCDPHLVAIEQEVSWKLFGSSRHFAEFERDALQRGDVKTRMEAYAKALGGSSGPGFMTPNEVRRRENLARSADPNADKLTVWTPKAAKPPKESDDDEADPAAR